MQQLRTSSRWTIVFTLCLFLTGAFHPGFAQKKRLTKDDARVLISVTDENKIAEPETKIEFRDQASDMVKSVTTDTAGKAEIILPQGKTFDAVAIQYGKDYHLPQPVEIPDVDGPLTFEFQIVLQSQQFYEKTYTLENVYFDLDKATLKESSYKPLNNLVEVMKQNSNMVIEIAGHTDNQGTESYNIKLSQRRAETVRDYLIKKGIGQSRIKAKGYGEADPIASNETENGRAKNRRTEVRIIKQ